MAKNFFKAIAVVAMAFVAVSCMEELKDASYEVLTESSVVENGKVRNLPTDPKELLIDNGQERFTFIYEGEVNKYDREVEVWGEVKDTVRTSNLNFRLAEKETATFSNTWEGDNDLRWSGTEQTAKTYWELSNGQYVFSFATNRRSSDAVCIAGDYPVKFPHLEWGLESNLTQSDPYTISLRDSLFNATRFDAEAIYTASVKEGFGNDTKNYKLINTLVVLDYIVPDPEDEVTGSYTKAWVEKQNDVLVGVVQKWEKHTLIPDVMVASESAEFTRSFEGGEDKMLDVENVSYQTNATTWRGTGAVNFKATATNGVKANEFNPYYTGRADAGKTIMGVKFTAEAVVNFVQQVIGTPVFTQDGDMYYNIYPYTGKAQMVYTVSCEGSSESLTANAEYNRSLREKAPDQKENDYANLDYTFEAEAEGRTLTSTKNDNSWNYVTTNYGAEVSSENHSVKLQLSVEAPELEDETFSSRDEMGKNDIKSITKLAASSKREVRDGHNVDVVTVPFEVVMKSGKRFNIIAKYDRPVESWLGYAEVSNITKAGCTNTANGDKVNVAPKYNVSVELHNITKPETKAGGNVKTYVIENPYNEIFVEENVLVNRWGEGTIEAKGDEIVGTASFYEKWSLEENPRLLNTQTTEFTFTLEGENGQPVYSDNTNFATSGDGWSGNGVVNYTDLAKNGSQSFENVYTGSADKDKTLSYEDMSVVFNTQLVLTEAGQTIGQPSAKTIGGKNHNAYPYSNKVNGVYTVSVDGKSASVEKSATAGRDILVLGDNLENRNENYAYSFEAEENGNVLVSSINDNVWEQNTYNNGAYVSSDKKSMHMELSVTAPKLEDIKFANKADMGQNDVKSITKLAASSKRISRDGVAVDEVTTPFEVVMKNGKKFNIIAKHDRPVDGSLSYAEVSNITKASWTNVPDGDNVIVTPKYNVAVELHDNSKPATKAGNVKNYVIENSYREIYEPVNELVDTYREPSIENGKPTVKTYEVWSLENTPRLVNTESYSPKSSQSAKAGEDVYAENTNFATTSNGAKNVKSSNSKDGNWTVTSETADWTSTMSNGAVSADNQITYSYDKSIVYKNGNDVFTFNGQYVVSEKTDAIKANGEKKVNGVNYNVSLYKTNFTGEHSISLNGSTAKVGSHENSVTHNILVVKETPKVIPDDWGKIVGAAMTAVPAHALDKEGFKFADGNGVQTAHKCLAIRTDKGYIPVVFLMSEVVPTEAQILAGDFTSGNFGAEWNSGCDVYRSGKWIPAKAEDAGTSIKYRTNVGNRSISNETLEQWGWRAGQSYSTRVAVDGYTFSVSNDGTLTITYGGNVVMSIR